MAIFDTIGSFWISDASMAMTGDCVWRGRSHSPAGADMFFVLAVNSGYQLSLEEWWEYPFPGINKSTLTQVLIVYWLL